MNRQTSSRLPACTPPADPGSAAVVAHAAESSSGACIPHSEKTGWDKLPDSRFVLAKGAGPGIWNRWETHVFGHRVFWSSVQPGYLA